MSGRPIKRTLRGPESMTPPETVSTTASGDAHATAPLTCTFGPQGPTLGDLIDAYLQDYQVRQFRSVSGACAARC